MPDETADAEYWERRAERLGTSAAGYSDAAMDAYEDTLRALVINRLLGKAGGRTLLDVGCGSGRWSVRLAQAGWVVTGVDLSARLIAMAPRVENVSYIVSPIQELDLPDSSFDAWLSVTALQHITADDDFEAAIMNLTRMLRPGGIAAMLEYSPLWLSGTGPAYLRRRSRGQWIKALTAHGYRREHESGVRFVGHIPYMLAVRASRALGARHRELRLFRTVSRAVDIALSRVPGLSLAADVRMIVFAKTR